MTISLENEVVVVTGGASRIGRAIALQCADSGASVAITFHTSTQEAAQTLADLRERSTLGSQKFAAISCDLAQSEEIFSLGEKVIEAVGAPTALVNNAAIFRRTPFEQTEYSNWEKSFDEHINTNLKAPYLLCKIFGDLFLKNHVLKTGRGSIVNLADIYGARPLKNYAAYGVSKAGVLLLSETLAKALAPGVRVNAICPGTILLPSESQSEGQLEGEEEWKKRIPLQRLGTPEEIAQAVVFLIGGPQFISGAVLAIDGAQRLT